MNEQDYKLPDWIGMDERLKKAWNEEFVPRFPKSIQPLLMDNYPVDPSFNVKVMAERGRLA